MLSCKTRRYRIEENKIRMLSYKIFHYDIKEVSMYFYIATEKPNVWMKTCILDQKQKFYDFKIKEFAAKNRCST